jgi:hypothetical protein
MPTADYTPAVADVAALLPARTTRRGSGGAELGTFDETTRPTAAQVETLIAQAVKQLAGRIGPDLPSAETKDSAEWLASLFAAMLVETTYFPEQVRQQQSSYPQLKDLYDEGLEGLLKVLGTQAPEPVRRAFRHGTLRVITPLTPPPDPPVV